MSARCAPASRQAAWHIYAVQEDGWSCGLWEMSRVCRDGVASVDRLDSSSLFPGSFLPSSFCPRQVGRAHKSEERFMAGLSIKLNVGQSQRSLEVASTRKGQDRLMDSRRVARAAWSRSASHHELLRGELGISSSQGGNGSYFESCWSKGLQFFSYFFFFLFQLSLSQSQPLLSREDAEQILGEGRWQPQGCWTPARQH